VQNERCRENVRAGSSRHLQERRTRVPGKRERKSAGRRKSSSEREVHVRNGRGNGGERKWREIYPERLHAERTHSERGERE